MTLTEEIIRSKISELDIMKDAGTTLLVLDEDLHILFLNGSMVDTPTNGRSCPGDIFACQNALNSKAGCGTHSNCKNCRLRNAVTKSISNSEKMNGECSLLLDNNNEFDVNFTSTPFVHDGRHYAFVLLIDTTTKSREMMVERIFFHDVLNLSGALKGLLDCADAETMPEMLDMLRTISSQLMEEIQSQRDVIYAQKGMLQCNTCARSVSEIIDFTIESVRPYIESNSKVLKVESNITDEQLLTDSNLLHRVLLNLLKNACESKVGSEVLFQIQTHEGQIIFSVHNEGCIPETVRSEIFKYGNTTKGAGRGLGTYSSKLIGENYLKGRVWFTSSESEGTTFHIALPLHQTD